MLSKEQEDEIASYVKTVAANALLAAVDEHKKSLAPPPLPATSTSDIPVTIEPMRDREPSLLGLDSKAPTPITWFSRFMIWRYPDKAKRETAVNTLVRRGMQIVTLATGVLVLYLTSLVNRLEAKVDAAPSPTVTIEIVDAGATDGATE